MSRRTHSFQPCFRGSRTRYPGGRSPVCRLSTQTARANWTASYVITGNFITSIRGMAEFRSGNHALLMEEGREDI